MAILLCPYSVDQLIDLLKAIHCIQIWKEIVLMLPRDNFSIFPHGPLINLLLILFAVCGLRCVYIAIISRLCHSDETLNFNVLNGMALLKLRL